MSNLTSVIFLLASIGIFFGYVSPVWSSATGETELRKKSISELREEKGLYLDALTKSREVEEAKSGLLKKYTSLSTEDLDRLSMLLPDNIDSVRFIIDINALAAGYGMTLKNVSIEEETSDNSNAKSGEARAIGPKKKLYQSMGIKFIVSGDYADLRSFLSDLEANLRLSDIKKLEFTAKGDSDYDFSVVLDTYRLN